MRIFRPILVLLLSSLFAHCLKAHRQPVVFTAITRNSNTDSIEVVHQLHAHDAEIVLDTIAPNHKLTLDSLEGRARLAIYAEGKFQIVNDENREPIKLTLLGSEIERHFVHLSRMQKHLP